MAARRQTARRQTAPKQTARRQTPARAAKGGGDASKDYFPIFNQNNKREQDASFEPPAKRSKISQTTSEAPLSSASNDDVHDDDIPNTPIPITPPPSPGPPEPPLEDEDNRPLPFGRPPLTAVNRQSLCETVPWYRAYQSGPYMSNGLIHGFLLDSTNGERSYMGEEVVITRAGGGFKASADGSFEQVTNQSDTSAPIQAMQNNKKKMVPIGLIVGSANEAFPVQIPDRYCIMDWFHVTNIWTEKSAGSACKAGKVAFKFRFEKVNLQNKSWWAPANSPLPPIEPSLVKARRVACVTCHHQSIQVYEAGWICLNQRCHDFWLLGGRIPPANMTFNPDFLAERTPWPDHVKAPYELVPTALELERTSSGLQHSLSAWKGRPCPLCARCVSRVFWFKWVCSCGWVDMVKFTPLSYLAVMADHAVEYVGHALPLDQFQNPVIEHLPHFIGHWRLQIFEILPGNIIIHFTANRKLNHQSGGAHDMFKTMQENDIGLQRFALENSPIGGQMLTKHFTSNFGMPYKFVVSVNSKGFSEAPKVIMDGLTRLTWAGQQTVHVLNKLNRINDQDSEDENYLNCNELLALGYFENQSIGYHDDGEENLGPTVATMSLGGDALMTVRMKRKHYVGKEIDWRNYDSSKKVLAGCQMEKELLELQKMCQDGESPEEIQQAKEKIQVKAKAQRTRTAPPCLTMLIKHGDMVVMHGPALQSIYEHSVVPQNKLRFALTTRYIKPSSVPEDQQWKGKFDIPDAESYDGSVAIENPTQI